MEYKVLIWIEWECKLEILFEGVKEMENAGFLMAAFAIIWALFFIYLIFLHTRQRRLHREIESLQELIKEKRHNDGYSWA